MNERWLVTILASASVAVLATTACGGGGDGATPAATAPPASATTNQINQTPRDNVQDGGSFTWPLDQVPMLAQ